MCVAWRACWRGRPSASTAPYCSHLAWSFARWRRCSSVEYVEYSPFSRLAIARNPGAIWKHYVPVEALGRGRGLALPLAESEGGDETGQRARVEEWRLIEHAVGQQVEDVAGGDQG